MSSLSSYSHSALGSSRNSDQARGRRKGPAEAFEAAGAHSASTAQVPSVLGVKRSHAFSALERAGALVYAGDGKYFLRPECLKKHRMTVALRMGAYVSLGLFFAAVALLAV